MRSPASRWRRSKERYAHIGLDLSWLLVFLLLSSRVGNNLQYTSETFARGGLRKTKKKRKEGNRNFDVRINRVSPPSQDESDAPVDQEIDLQEEGTTTAAVDKEQRDELKNDGDNNNDSKEEEAEAGHRNKWSGTTFHSSIRF